MPRPGRRRLSPQAREQFLGLIQTGLKRFSACRVLKVSAQALKNTIASNPEFRRALWDAEDERRETYHTTLHRLALDGNLDAAKFLYVMELKADEQEEARERWRQAIEQGTTPDDATHRAAFALGLVKWLLPLIDPDKLDQAMDRLDQVIGGSPSPVSDLKRY